MFDEYGYASEPQKVKSNQDVSNNALYTGLGIAAVAGAVGLAYGIDQNSDEANKYWAERRKEKRQEKNAARRQREKAADANRRVVMNRRQDAARGDATTRAERVTQPGSWKDVIVDSYQENKMDKMHQKAIDMNIEHDRQKLANHLHNQGLNSARKREQAEWNAKWREGDGNDARAHNEAIKNAQQDPKFSPKAARQHNEELLEKQRSAPNPIGEHEERWIRSGLVNTEDDLRYMRSLPQDSIDLIENAHSLQQASVPENRKAPKGFNFGRAVSKVL